MSLFHDGHDHSHVHPRRRFVNKSFFFLGALGAPLRAFAHRPPQHDEKKKEVSAVSPAHPAQGRPVVSSRQPATRPPFPVFDAHLHCPSDETGEIWQWYPVTKNFAEFAAYLDRTGVQRGIINSQRCQQAKSPADFIAGNREVARYVDKYKGRFLGACVVNPLFIDESLKEIEFCQKELGFNWVGELCNYVVPYDYRIEEFELLVEQVSKLNMVLDVHTELDEMHYIIHKYPHATIVFPHFGSDDQIFRRLALVAEHQNTYIDTSGYGIDRMGMLEYAVKTMGEDRILFGSDFSINCPATVTSRIHNAFLTDDQKQKILSGNLDALVKKLGA